MAEYSIFDEDGKEVAIARADFTVHGSVVSVRQLREALAGFADSAFVMVQHTEDEDDDTVYNISSVGQLCVQGVALPADHPQYSVWLYIK
jgi:hypothetical protein